MLIIWSARLGIFLLYRMFIRDRGGDDRLDSFRVKPQTLLIFWVSHCSWCIIVSLPVTIFNLIIFSNITNTSKDTINSFCNESFSLSQVEYLGVFVWIIGMFFSGVGDQQKLNHYEAHKNDKQKRFCDVGVWKWSRNPNFGGEVILWQGMAIISSYNLWINPVLKGTGMVYRLMIVMVPQLAPLFTAFVLIGWSGGLFLHLF